MVVRAQVPQVVVVVVIDMEETRIDVSGLDEVSGQRLAPIADSRGVRIVECRVLTASYRADGDLLAHAYTGGGLRAMR